MMFSHTNTHTHTHTHTYTHTLTHTHCSNYLQNKPSQKTPHKNHIHARIFTDLWSHQKWMMLMHTHIQKVHTPLYFYRYTITLKVKCEGTHTHTHAHAHTHTDTYTSHLPSKTHTHQKIQKSRLMFGALASWTFKDVSRSTRHGWIWCELKDNTAVNTKSPIHTGHLTAEVFAFVIIFSFISLYR